MKITLYIAILVWPIAFATSASAQLSLRINGDVLAAPGDVELVRFWPGERKLEIRTFFEDIRCETPDTPPVEAISLRLDQLNEGSMFEPEAAYAIPEGGSVSYRPDSDEIEIATSGIQQTEAADCYHQFLSAVGTIDPATGLPSKGAVRVDSFENSFQLSATPSATGVGFDLELSNVSALFAGRSVKIPLNLQVSSSLDPVPQPSFNPNQQVDDESLVWTVPLLWPDETATLEIRYQGLNSGDLIDLTVSDPQTGEAVITAQNRNPDAPDAPYFLPSTVVTEADVSTSITVP